MVRGAGFESASILCRIKRKRRTCDNIQHNFRLTLRKLWHHGRTFRLN